jgi:hypothetical protein
MKQHSWWSPERPAGTLLSSKWVQTYIFELPRLRQSELAASLHYKVQAMLPLKVDAFAFHTRFFSRGKINYGVAFIANEETQKQLSASPSRLYVGVPLYLPKQAGESTLLFIVTPEGLSPHYYDKKVLKISFPPIPFEDLDLRAKIKSQYSQAEIWSIAPIPGTQLPRDLVDYEAPKAAQKALADAFPLLDEPRARLLPLMAGIALAVIGIVLIQSALNREIVAREERNAAWKTWIAKTSQSMPTTASHDKASQLLLAQGAPVPELFEHLARDWGESAKIDELDWAGGKLRLTATSRSALESARKLKADPWFRDIRVLDIKTQKDGMEELSLEGALHLDE